MRARSECRMIILGLIVLQTSKTRTRNSSLSNSEYVLLGVPLGVIVTLVQGFVSYQNKY